MMNKTQIMAPSHWCSLDRRIPGRNIRRNLLSAYRTHYVAGKLVVVVVELNTSDRQDRKAAQRTVTVTDNHNHINRLGIIFKKDLQRILILFIPCNDRMKLIKIREHLKYYRSWSEDKDWDEKRKGNRLLQFYQENGMITPFTIYL